MDASPLPGSTTPWTEDPRLVGVYDVECAGRWDHDFYLALVRRLGARRVTDLGCGTGVLAVDLAARGHAVTGLDPAGPMLALARTRPGGDRVRWVQGYAETLADGSADLVVMEGHVAQYFLTEADWAQVLRHTHRALSPGGHLAFESRDPRARAWEGWTARATRASYPHPDGGTFEAWVEVEQVRQATTDPLVTHRGHTLLPDGTHLSAPETLRFRRQATLAASLEQAGFTVVQTLGDWDGAPVTVSSTELIVTAHRA